MSIPRLLVVGSPQHGVTQYARDLGQSIATLTRNRFTEPTLDALEAEHAAAMTSVPVHVHVTDRIFGSSPDDAADRIERMAHVCRLTITLHDLPQPSDGERNLRRRSAAYRRMADAASAVAVSSAHESALFAQYVDASADSAPAVVPLGLRDRPAFRLRPPSIPNSQHNELVVLIAGFVYPGKGHEDAIRAAATAAEKLRQQAPDLAVRVRALGGTSAGHESEQRRLSSLAAALDVHFDVTGYLADEDYAMQRLAPGVPLAAHQHVSASRTMLDWVEAGRTPLVVASDYAREMDALRPGTLQLYDPDHLSDALEAAWRDPGSTYLSASIVDRWTLEDAARAYLHWWQESATR